MRGWRATPTKGGAADIDRPRFAFVSRGVDTVPGRAVRSGYLFAFFDNPNHEKSGGQVFSAARPEVRSV